MLLTAAMSLIRDDYHYLWPGLVLLACTAACSELATVPYNAMLRQLSTPQTSGRISGFGSGMGYFGSVVLLLIVYLGLHLRRRRHPRTAGRPDRPTARTCGRPCCSPRRGSRCSRCPCSSRAPLRSRRPSDASDVGFFGAYRRLWAEVVSEWRRDRNVVYYLLASAVFRDGLAGVFAFGAVLGVTVYGISQADVLLFGVSASVVAAVGAVLGGLLDDRVGSKTGHRRLADRDDRRRADPADVVGSAGVLDLRADCCACSSGPTQSSARTLMLRMSAEGKEGVAFGLYTTTGRAVSFLAPWLFFTFIDSFGTDRAGMGGLCVVLALGLSAMLAVQVPQPVGALARCGADRQARAGALLHLRRRPP